MGKLVDLTNKRFGRLFAVGRDGTKHGEAAWRCWCDCGKDVVVQSGNLRSGNTQSCGCLHSEVTSSVYSSLNKTHGMTKSREYMSWFQLKQRCLNANHHAWGHYGGRGISVCARWMEFENFLADMGPRPAKTSIDRIDPDGNYEPNNCRWADARTQRLNRSKKVIL